MGGAYHPPPFGQLGTILEDSINRDPDRLTRSLRDQADMPPAFRAAESTGFTHLTLKTPEPNVKTNDYSRALGRTGSSAGGEHILILWITSLFLNRISRQFN